MDKIIKTISESGAFRAYVLDSTETVRTAQEKHQTQASSTVALGRTLIASQILAANEKGDTKITVKVLGTSSLGAIITVADTSGNVKGQVFTDFTGDKRCHRVIRISSAIVSDD